MKTKDKTDLWVRMLDYARSREQVEPELAARMKEKAWEEIRRETEERLLLLRRSDAG